MSTRYQAVQKSPFFLCSYFVFKQLYPQGTGAGLLGLTVFCSAAFEYCKPSPAAWSQQGHSLCHGSGIGGNSYPPSSLQMHPLLVCFGSRAAALLPWRLSSSDPPGAGEGTTWILRISWSSPPAGSCNGFHVCTGSSPGSCCSLRSYTGLCSF